MATIANFKNTYPNRRKTNGLTVGCIVTLKDDGKISITKKWGGFYSPDYYPMEKEIRDLLSVGVEGFKNPLFLEVRSNESVEDKKLVEIIRAETKELLAQYIKMCKEFAKKEFEYFQTLTPTKILEMFGRKGQDHKGDPYIFRTRKSVNFTDKVQNVLYKGMEAHLEKAEKDAVISYNFATERVVYKIKEKGLVMKDIKVSSERIDIRNGDLQMRFTDGVNAINCFTILAWGEKNAPHYRYLIK